MVCQGRRRPRHDNATRVCPDGSRRPGRPHQSYDIIARRANRVGVEALIYRPAFDKAAQKYLAYMCFSSTYVLLRVHIVLFLQTLTDIERVENPCVC